MAEFWVRKQGEVCTYYQDETGRSIPFDNYEQPPEFYSLIQTLSYTEMKAAEKHHKVHYIERPRREEREGADPTRLSAAQMRPILEGMGKSQEEIEKLLAPRTEVSKPIVIPTAEAVPLPYVVNTNQQTVDLEEIEMKEQIKQEFRMLLVKYEATKSAEDKAEAQAVANFILRVAPEMEQELVALKEAASKPRFTL